jgi:alkylation response protein AidB-like acyl-CoA dehydrogenase
VGDPRVAHSGRIDGRLRFRFALAMETISRPVEGASADSPDLLERARSLAPLVVAALLEAGLLAAFLPRALGGEEWSLPQLVALVAELARQDGATGWCFGMNGVITSVCAAHLPDEGIEQVYGVRDPRRVLMAGGFPPLGRATREGKGYRVSGHFRFGSGILHADHVVCTALELEGDAPILDGGIPLMRTFVVPRAEVRVDANWDVAGLQGTGSCDYHLDDLWLPDALTFVSSHPDPHRGESLYGLPLLSVANAAHSGFALGVGRRALEEIASEASARHRLASRAPLAERPAFQLGYARARARLDAAEALVERSAEALHSKVAEGRGAELSARGRRANGACAESVSGAGATSGSGVSLQRRAAFSAATVLAYEAALDAARVAFRAAGGAALHRDGRLQRCLRDIEAGAQHIVPSEESWERIGQVWLGLGDPGMV